MFVADKIKNWLEIATYKPEPVTQEQRLDALKEKWEREAEAKRRYVDIKCTATLYEFQRSKAPNEFVWRVNEIKEVKHNGRPIEYKVYKGTYRDGLWYRYTPVEKNVAVTLRVSFHWGEAGEPTFAAPIIFYKQKETGVIEKWQPLGRGETVTTLGVWTHVKHTSVRRER